MSHLPADSVKVPLLLHKRETKPPQIGNFAMWAGETAANRELRTGDGKTGRRPRRLGAALLPLTPQFGTCPITAPALVRIPGLARLFGQESEPAARRSCTPVRIPGRTALARQESEPAAIANRAYPHSGDPSPRAAPDVSHSSYQAACRKSRKLQLE